MDRIRISGMHPLEGSIPISGAKNSALPLIIASLLTDKPVILKNIPHLADVSLLLQIIRNYGVDCLIKGKSKEENFLSGLTIKLHAEDIFNTMTHYKFVSQMRASFWTIAPLVARCGEAKVSLPGGCAIGTRPVNLLLMALERLGTQITLEEGYVIARAPSGGLQGNEINFPLVTVGGTHVAILAAVLASGKTVINNAACEPEIVDLICCLKKMGAKIIGAGTKTIEITGVSSLNGCEHTVLPDRIETGTYAMAALITGGDITLSNTDHTLLTTVLDKLVEAGAIIDRLKTSIRCRVGSKGLQACNIETAVYPGFPSDLQAQFTALMTLAKGVSSIKETIYDNRFMHIQELARLGADIKLLGQVAMINGVDKLKAAEVMATDLRASVCLVIAALAAQGTTIVNRIYHLDRGFEQLEIKLGNCGAQIARLN